MSSAPPYRGLEPFADTDEDARRFFGRDRERDVLIANLMAHRLTVLHGESGAGKSSLLRAGVAHSLRGAPGAARSAVVVFADWQTDPLGRLADAVDDAVALVLGRSADPGRASWPLVERLAAAEIALEGGLFVLLDQVEELLLYHGRDDAQLRELGAALATRGAGASFLLGVRDDALGALDALRGPVPAILHNTIRLEHLDRDQAEQATRRPVEVVNRDRDPDEQVAIEDGLVDAVLDQVAVGRVELSPARGMPGNAGHGGVVAPYLQLVLDRVWREEQDEGSRTLRLATLERLGGAEAIVGRHLDDALAALDERQRDVVARVLVQLVTPSGAKVAHTTQDLAGYARTPSDELLPTLEELAAQRVLRPLTLGGSRAFEIFHDVLAPSILAWTQAHDREQAIRRQRQLARARQRSLAIIALLLAALSVFALVEWRHADRDKTSARAQALAATATSDLISDPEQSLALAADAVRLSANDTTTGVLRQALIAANERARIRLAAPVASAAFSPDGDELLVVPRAGAARIVRARDGHAIRSLAGSSVTRAAIWSPDGQTIATLAAAPARRVALWNVSSGRVRTTLPDQGVRFIGYAANGRRLLTASADRLRVHDARTGGLERSITQGTGISAAEISPDGSRVAAIDGRGHVHVYRVSDGRSVYALSSDGVTALAFSADGSRLAAQSAHAARVFEVATGAPLLTVPVGGSGRPTDVTAIALSTRGTRLLVGDSNGTTRVWSVTGRQQTGILVGQLGRVTSAAFSRGGRWLLTASADHTARVWRAADDGSWTLLAGSTDSVISAAFSPNAGAVVTVSEDGSARVWSAGTTDPLQVITRAGGPVSAAISVPGSSDALLAGPGRRATVVDTSRRRVVLRLRESAPVVAVAASAQLLATATDHHATIWTRNGHRRLLLDAPVTVTSVALDARGRVAVGTASGAVRLYGADGTLVRVLSGPRSRVESVSFSADGTRVVAGLASMTAWIWDVDGDILKILRGHRDQVLAARFGPDDSLVATASRDHDARLWDARTGSLVHILRLHVGRVRDVAFSPNGQWVVTAGPSSAGLFPTATGEYLLVLTGPRAPLVGVWFSDDGMRIYASSDDGVVREYDCQVCGTEQQLLDLARSRLRAIGG